MGAVGAILLSILHGRFSPPVVWQAMQTTARITAMVVFILIGARVFSLTFYGVNGHVWVEHLLTSLPGGQLGFLIVVNLLIFVLAFFLDFFELAFIIIPLVGPVAEKLGVDLVWFGILLAVNMQTSFMHPPFGFALFYLRSVAPAKAYIDKITKRNVEPVTTGQIYWGSVPFVLIQVLMVGLIIAFPDLVSGGLAKKEKIDTRNLHIEIPAAARSGPGGVNTQQEDATKALERAMRGESAPEKPADEDDDAAKALERAMGADKDGESKGGDAQPAEKK